MTETTACSPRYEGRQTYDQFRQLDYDRLEVVLATSDIVDAETEERVRQSILKRLPASMDISFVYVDEIAREPGGKYQEFVSLVS